MPRPRSRLRREEILTAAVQQIASRGVSATRAADVATSLEISTGLIFYHFGSLEQLIAESFAFAVDQDLSRLREVVAGSGSVRERMTHALVNYGPSADAAEWRLWVDGWSQAQRNEPLREIIIRLDDAWRDGLETLLQQGRDSGAFTIDEPEIVAAAIINLMDGMSVQAVIRGETPTMGVRRAAAARTVVALLGMDAESSAAMRAELDAANAALAR